MAEQKTNEKIFKQFQKILAQKLKLKEQEIKLNSRLVDDIGVDSVDFWEIIAKIEQEFGIDVKDDDVKKVETVQDVITALGEKLKPIKRKRGA